MKTALKNTVSVAGADAASRLLGFLVTAYLGRTLGVAAFGMMNIGLSVLGYALLFSSPGLQAIGTRDVAAGTAGESTYAGRMLSLRLVLSVVFTACTAILCAVLPGDSEQRIVIVVFTSTSLAAALSLDWYYQGRERLGVVSAGKIIMYILYLAAVVLFVSSSQDVVWSGVAFLIGTLGASLWMMAVYRKDFGALRFSWDWNAWKARLHDGLPIGFSLLLAQTIMNLPVLIVGVIFASSETGLFSAAMKLIYFLLMIDRVFYAVFLPAISRVRDDAQKFGETAAMGIKVVLAVCVPVAAIGAAFAAPIVGLVYGAGYADAAPAFCLLLPFVVCTVLNTVAMGTLVAVRREKEYLVIMAVGTGILVVLCVLLTSTMGIAGTALSITVGEAAMSVMFLVKLRAVVAASALRSLAAAALGGAVMLAILLSLKSVPAPVTMIAALVSFAIVVPAAGGWTMGDLRYFRQRFL